MLPAVWPGDTLVVEHAGSDDVSEGDIVLFSRNSRFVAHRVRSKSPGDSRIQTQGDAVPVPDTPISSNDVLGKVSLILRNGQSIEPRRRSRLSERAVAALVRNSEIAARVLVAVQSIHQTS
jgi:signal peptidase I